MLTQTSIRSRRGRVLTRMQLDSLNRISPGHKPFLFGVNVAERLTASQIKMPSDRR